jgi:predicted HTH domain antitoxin
VVEVEKSTVVTIRLTKQNLRRVEAVRALENVDRSTLFKEFIEDGLRERVLQLYQKGKLTQRCAAEILGITLREFLELLEEKCIPINWDSDSIKKYMKEKYGE